MVLFVLQILEWEIIECPIVKLYPLEVSNSNNEEEPQTTSSDLSKQQTVDKPVLRSDHPRRKAATKALQQISKWTETLNRAWEDVENN